MHMKCSYINIIINNDGDNDDWLCLMHTVVLVSLAVAVTMYSPGKLNVSSNINESLYGVAPAASPNSSWYCMSEGPSTRVRLNCASVSTATTPFSGWNIVRRRPFSVNGTW